jgi:hypothetical protein
MKHRAHFLLLAFLGLGGLAFSVAADAPMVRVPSFDVAYSVSEAAMPLTEVELWFTRDEGRTWELSGRDEDRHSPIRFHAQAEGLFGFFLVLRNSTGPSSGPPTADATPHQWAFVDYTMPVVQLHPARPTEAMGERVVQVRWTAIDTQLGARPVQLEFRSAGSEEWKAASDEPLANTGRFDWRLPSDATGTVSIRVAVTDRGGNRVVTEPQTVQLEPATPAEPAPRPESGTQRGPEEDLTLPGSQRAQERIARLLDEAARSAAGGETARAIAKLREVVRLDPQRTEAFVSLGGLLRQSGDQDRALHAYEIALQQQPQLRAALVGSALVLREKREYDSAAARLRTVLRYVPDDAEAWMILGDVAVFQGNELLARDCYRRATQIDPAATQVIADAQQRLAILTKNQKAENRD